MIKRLAGHKIDTMIWFDSLGLIFALHLGEAKLKFFCTCEVAPPIKNRHDKYR